METERILTKGFRQEVGVLETRWYLRDFKLSHLDKLSQDLDKLSQEVAANVDVLRVRRSHWVDPHLNRTVVVLKNVNARIPKIKQKKTP